MVAGLATVAVRARAWSAVGPRALRLRPVLAGIVTFHLVTVAWIFFQATSLDEVHIIVTRILTWADDAQPLAVAGFDNVELALAAAFVIVLESVQAVQERGAIASRLARMPAFARLVLYAGIVMVILLFGRFDERAFIYFQF